MQNIIRPTLIFLLAVTVITLTIPLSHAENSVTEQTYYFLTDHLGSVDAVLDEDGNVVERKDYLPFGDEHITIGDNDEDYGYTGKEKDDETGLNYYGARYYDSSLGRFTQLDPLVMNSSNKPLSSVLQNPQALNGYSYVLNNPLKFVDENGMYGSEIHYTLTYYLSIQAGLDSTAATEIAFCDDRVDTLPATAPRGDLVSIDGWIRTIVNISNGATDRNHFKNNEDAQKQLNAAINTGDNRKFGEALHPFQDSYSHDQQNEISHAISTGLEWLGIANTDPDNTANNLGKAMVMSRKTFMSIRELRRNSLNLDDEGIKAYNTESVQIWSSTSKDVKTYLSSKIKDNSKVNDKSGSSKNNKK